MRVRIGLHGRTSTPREPPEEHMQQLLESSDSLKKRFGDDESALKLVERETCCANEWIAENTPEEPESSPRKLGKVETPDEPRNKRSIFDDIDADADVASA
jgi:hypothetical protein